MPIKFDVRTQIELEPEVAVAEPPLYQVMMLNDDFTPMDFVVKVLIEIFGMDNLKAQQTMLEIHHLGEAICGVYPREVAEMKVSETLKMAAAHDYPLRCLFELAL